MNTYGQCDVRISTPSNSVCIGDTFSMTAIGGCGIAFLVDFNDSTMQGLLSNNTQLIGQPCKASIDQTNYLWMGTITGQNIIYTPQLNLVAGGYLVYFDMVYGEEGVGGTCDGPSNTSEAVLLQYSINNGVTWVTIQNWNPNGGNDPNMINWKSYSVALPSAAYTAGTRFRWAQSSLPANTACWGIDNIKIQRYVPTQFAWSTGQFGANHPKISPNNTTTYSVTATSGSNYATDSITIIVHPRPSASFTTSRPLCKSTLIDLIYTGNAGSTATYHWTVQNASQLIDTNKAFAKAVWAKTGQYNVSLSVSNNYCTSLPSQVELLVEPLISFYISSSQGCVPLEVNYTGNVEPPTANYFWDFKDGNTSTLVNPSHIYETAGNYGLTLIAVTDSGCADTTSFPVLAKVFPNPEVNFTWSPDIIPWSNPVAVFINKTNGGNAYQWNFGDPSSGNNLSNLTSPDHEYSAKGLFDVNLVATTDKGCVDSITKTLRVADNEFILPNVITPNGDGFNETLMITNLESLKECKLEIYNRWGKMIYQSNNYKNDWDPSQTPDGVYFFRVQYVSWFGEDDLKGFFHIIRKY